MSIWQHVALLEQRLLVNFFLSLHFLFIRKIVFFFFFFFLLLGFSPKKPSTLLATSIHCILLWMRFCVLFISQKKKKKKKVIIFLLKLPLGMNKNTDNRAVELVSDSLANENAGKKTRPVSTSKITIVSCSLSYRSILFLLPLKVVWGLFVPRVVPRNPRPIDRPGPKAHHAMCKVLQDQCKRT